MSLKSREARKLAVAGLAAAAALSGATSAHAAVPTVPDITLEYECKYPLVDIQPLSIKVSSNIPSKALIDVKQPAFVVNAVASAGGDTAEAITTLDAQFLDGISGAVASLHFPSGFIQKNLKVPLTVDRWTRPNPLTSPLVITAKGQTPAVTLDELGPVDIKLDSISLNLSAYYADGTPIDVKKLKTDIEGKTVTDSDGKWETFDVYCRLKDPTKNTIATIQVVETLDENQAPAKVTGLKADSKDKTSVSLSWGASTDPNAGDTVSYKVLRNGTQVGTTQPGTTFTDTGLTAGTEYTYTVVATDGKEGGDAPASDELKVTTEADTPVNQAPAKVEGLKADSKDASSVSLSWGASIDPDAGDTVSYKVLRNGTQVGDTQTGTTFTDTGLTANTEYTYTVVATDGEADAPASAELKVTTDEVVVVDDIKPTTPGQGVYTDADRGTDFLVVRWLESTDEGGSGLKGYEIEYEGDEGPATVEVPAGTLSYKFTGLGAGSGYYFNIYAVDNAGNRSEVPRDEFLFTDEIVTPGNKAPAQVTGLKADSKDKTSVSLSWGASTDPDAGDTVSYKVLRNGTQVGTTQTGTTFTDTGLTAGTEYTYTVVATDGKEGGDAPASDALKVTTDADTPVNQAPAKVEGLKADSKDKTSVSLSWGASIDPDAGDTVSYKVLRNGTQVGETQTGTTFKDTGLTAGTEYKYTVVATDGELDAAASAELKVTTDVDTPVNTAPAKVAGLKSDAKDASSVTLSWGASVDPQGDAVTYKVLRDGKQVGTSATTSYKDSGLKASTEYTYTVIASDGKLDAAASDAVKVTTDAGQPPVGQAPVVSSVIGKTAFANIGGVALVSGKNLSKIQKVTVGTKNASFSSLGGSLALVVLPPLKKGSYDLTVTTAAGTSNATKITYISLW